MRNPLPGGIFLCMTLSFAFLALLSTGCSSTTELTSVPRPTEAVVDGRSTEWQGTLKTFEDYSLQVGIQNDAENVYLCMQTADRGMSRGMVLSGVTVWFHNKGGDNKRLGIRFPVGVTPGERGPERSSPSQEPQTNSPGEGVFEERLRESLGDLEVLGPGENDRMSVSTLSSEKEFGIKAALHDSGGVLVYELKVPRTPKQGSYGIGASHDSLLDVSVETSKFPVREGGSNGQPSGGRPRRGGGGRGRGGEERGGQGPMRGGEGGPRRNPGESVSLSFRVHLSPA